MRLDHIGGSIWPRSAVGIANAYPNDRQAYAVVLLPLRGTLEAGGLRLDAGAEGVFELPGSHDGLPVRYEFSRIEDAAHVVFVTQ